MTIFPPSEFTAMVPLPGVHPGARGSHIYDLLDIPEEYVPAFKQVSVPVQYIAYSYHTGHKRGLYAVDKDLYGFSGPCTKLTYSCSARQTLMSFFPSSFGLRADVELESSTHPYRPPSMSGVTYTIHRLVRLD